MMNLIETRASWMHPDERELIVGDLAGLLSLPLAKPL